MTARRTLFAAALLTLATAAAAWGQAGPIPRETFDPPPATVIGPSDAPAPPPTVIGPTEVPTETGGGGDLGPPDLQRYCSTLLAGEPTLEDGQPVCRSEHARIPIDLGDACRTTHGPGVTAAPSDGGGWACVRGPEGSPRGEASWGVADAGKVAALAAAGLALGLTLGRAFRRRRDPGGAAA